MRCKSILHTGVESKIFGCKSISEKNNNYFEELSFHGGFKQAQVGSELVNNSLNASINRLPMKRLVVKSTHS